MYLSWGDEVCLLGWSVVFDIDLVLLEDDGDDVVFAGDGCLLEMGGECSVDLAANLGRLGDGVHLPGRSVVFETDLVLLKEDGDDVVFAGDGVRDGPLCFFEGAGEWLH